MKSKMKLPGAVTPQPATVISSPLKLRACSPRPTGMQMGFTATEN